MITEATLIADLTLFLLAIFLGFELITKVPATLHTPLMSGANAISAPVNSFEFHSCERTSQAGYLTP